MPVLFPQMAGEHGATVLRLQKTGWKVDGPLLELLVVWLDASGLAPPGRKDDKDDWLACLGDMLQVYELEKLKRALPLVVADMRGDGLTVSRPGSVSNNLADYFARGEKVKDNGNHQRGSRKPVQSTVAAATGLGDRPVPLSDGG